MQYRLVSALALVASVSALKVTSPTKGAEVDLSQEVTIEWSAVETDPENFSIELVNMNVNPPVTVEVAKDVDASSGSVTIDPVDDVTSGKSYQFNFISEDPKNSGILAQSPKFTVEESDSDSTTTATSDATTSGTATTSATETETETGTGTETETETTATESATATDETTSGESIATPTGGSNSTATTTGDNSTSTEPPVNDNGASSLASFTAAGALMMAVAALL